MLRLVCVVCYECELDFCARYFLRLQIHTSMLHKFWQHFLKKKNFSITRETVVLLLLMLQGTAAAQVIVNVFVILRVQNF